MSDTNSTPRDFYVYVHRKATTGEVFYVGKGTGDRAWQSSRARRQRHWSSIVKKHGLIVQIVHSGLQEWAAHEIECGLIALHGRADCGLGPLINLTDGGEGGSGRVMSDEWADEHARKMRMLAKDPEWRARHAQSVRERSNSKAWKDRNAEGAKKRSADASWRLKLAEKAKERAADPKYRQKLSTALKAKASDPAWMARTAAINREIRGKAVLCVCKGVRFDAISDAVRWLHQSGWGKACTSMISAAASGKRPRAYGYTWRYAE